MRTKLGDFARLAHIRDALADAIGFARETTYEQFANDRKTLLACSRCVEIVGEATNHLTEEFKTSCPAIMWQALIKARNFYTHQYFAINNRQLWQTVTEDFPPLLAEVELLLPTLPRPL